MKSEYYWEAEYFEVVICPLVFGYRNQYPWVEVSEEFTIEDFIKEFNRIPSYKRKYGKYNCVLELIPHYSYHYNIVSRMLHCMVKKNYLSVRYVSVGTRTEQIFKLN